jgi:hypothetical protein
VSEGYSVAKEIEYIMESAAREVRVVGLDPLVFFSAPEPR